jgi:hypothetical protein
MLAPPRLEKTLRVRDLRGPLAQTDPFRDPGVRTLLEG